MKTITLCGSMKFYSKMLELQRFLKEFGFKVFIPTPENGKAIDYDSLSDEELANIKNGYINEHINKIKESDAILIVNFDKNGIKDYIGANAFLEMGFAYILGKKIFILNAIPDQPNKTEILGLMPIVLNGDVESLKTKV